MRTALQACLLTAVVMTVHGSAAQPDKTIAFTNVSIVPMDSNRIIADQTVIVSADRIMVIGSAATTPVPDGVLRVDGRGKYLMPGLAEMHGHIPPPTAPEDFTKDVLFLYVANGVTTVRGMQGAAGQLVERPAVPLPAQVQRPPAERERPGALRCVQRGQRHTEALGRPRRESRHLPVQRPVQRDPGPGPLRREQPVDPEDHRQPMEG